MKRAGIAVFVVVLMLVAASAFVPPPGEAHAEDCVCPPPPACPPAGYKLVADAPVGAPSVDQALERLDAALKK